MTTPVFKPIIQNLSDQPISKTIAALWYGPAGSGKTWASGTYGERTLFIDLEHGLTTLQSPKFQRLYPGNPLVIKINGQDANAYDQLCDTIDFVFEDEATRNRFDVLVIDSVSALRVLTIRKGVEVAEDLKKSDTNAKYKKTGVLSPQVQDWGEEMNVMLQFMGDVVEKSKIYEKHLIIIAHERHTYGKAPKIGEPQPLLNIRPGFTGKTFPNDITRIFDIVWYFTGAGKGDRRIYQALTAGDEIKVAKTRYNGIFKEEETNVNLRDIIKRIKEQAVVVEDTSM